MHVHSAIRTYIGSFAANFGIMVLLARYHYETNFEFCLVSVALSSTSKLDTVKSVATPNFRAECSEKLLRKNNHTFCRAGPFTLCPKFSFFFISTRITVGWTIGEQPGGLVCCLCIFAFVFSACLQFAVLFSLAANFKPQEAWVVYLPQNQCYVITAVQSTTPQLGL